MKTDSANPRSSFAQRLQHAVFLRQLRDQTRITQEQLAREVSAVLGRQEVLRSATVGRWLLDQSVPDVYTILALSQVLGVDPGWLAFGNRTLAPAPEVSTSPPDRQRERGSPRGRSRGGASAHTRVATEPSPSSARPKTGRRRAG